MANDETTEPSPPAGTDDVGALLAHAFEWDAPAPSEAPAPPVPGPDDPPRTPTSSALSALTADPDLREAFISSATRALESESADPADLGPDAVSDEGEAGDSASPRRGEAEVTTSRAEAEGLLPAPTDADRAAAAVDELAHSFPGFIAAATVRVSDDGVVAGYSKFDALGPDTLAVGVMATVRGVVDGMVALGGAALLGDVGALSVDTQAATLHIAVVDAEHLLAVIADPPASSGDRVTQHESLLAAAAALAAAVYA